jgi:hypothetical protein
VNHEHVPLRPTLRTQQWALPGHQGGVRHTHNGKIESVENETLCCSSHHVHVVEGFEEL